MSKSPNGVTLKQFSDPELREALLHVEDIMGRALLELDMVVLKDTAKSMKEGLELYGDGIDIGIDERYIIDNTIGILKVLRDAERLIPEGTEFTKDGFEYEYHGVPIRVKFLHRRWPWFQNPSEAFYYTGNYRIPNPFDKYWKARFIVR